MKATDEARDRQRLVALLRSGATVKVNQVAARFDLEFAEARRLCRHELFRIARDETVTLAAAGAPRVLQPRDSRAPAKPWTAEEDAILRAEFVEAIDVKRLAERLRRPAGSVYQRASMLGLRRKREQVKAAKSAIFVNRKMKERETAEPGV